MLTVYGRRTSSNVQIVMWAIAELGLDCERLDYGHRYGGTDTSEYAALNPNRLVPTLIDGDLVLWESGAILRYLAARHGSEAFWPSDPVKRAPIDKWAEWGKVTLGAAFSGPIFWPSIKPAGRDEAALSAALQRYGKLLDILEVQLEGHDYVCGMELTAADMTVANLLYRYFEIDVPRSDRPNLAAYYKRLTERPAYREHVMVPFDELKAG